MKMSLYDLNSIPDTVGWVNTLSAPQAIAQCTAWGIKPGATLEENRVLLKQVIKSKKSSDTLLDLEQEDLSNLQTLSNTNLQLPATATSTNKPDTPIMTTLTTTSTDFTTACLNSIPPTETPTVPSQPTIPHQSQPLPLDPSVQFLIQSLQTMTLNAVTQTVSSITDQAKLLQPSRPNENEKCPPFIRDLLKELPKASGDNHHQTVLFLKKLHQIIQMGLKSDKFIILHSLPYTTNRFREFWMSTIAQKLSWHETLQIIRETFFTVDTLREMQNQYLYRHQNQQEHLADYVKDIQTLHTILSPDKTESEIFQTIFRGINQQTRTTFAGLKPINSIQDLLDVAPLSASLLHQPSTSSRPTNNTQFQPRYQSQSRPNNPSSYNQRPNSQYTTYPYYNRSNWNHNPNRNPSSYRPQYYQPTQHQAPQTQHRGQPYQYPSNPSYQTGSSQTNQFQRYPRTSQTNNHSQRSNNSNQPPANNSQANLNKSWGGR
jgi:hypothetical protein